jgi:pimeloyl-ACP methyl ester carboxylesterase
MTTPEWLKPGAYGAVIGAVAAMVVGFSWGGWMTGGGANELAADRAHDEVIAALVPVCLQISQDDPDRVAKLATITEATTYQRRDAVMAAGWATVPGAEAADRDLAQACIEVLDLEAA